MQDIAEDNMLINYYRLDENLERLKEHLHSLPRGADITWALMDYDMAIMLPTDISLKGCRLPSEVGMIGAGRFRAPDAATHGRPEYNPFACDVATLGYLLRYYMSVSGSRSSVHIS